MSICLAELGSVVPMVGSTVAKATGPHGISLAVPAQPGEGWGAVLRENRLDKDPHTVAVLLQVVSVPPRVRSPALRSKH